MRTKPLAYALAVLAPVAITAPVAAQPPAITPTPAPDSDVVPLPADQASGERQDGAEAACVPECRSGFICLAGQCVSACNPPCSAGQQCTAAAECIWDPHSSATFRARSAPSSPPDPGAEQHDGFMLRGTIGFGAGTMTRHGSPRDYLPAEGEFSGAAYFIGLDIGFALIPNLVLHVRLAGVSIFSPNTTFDGEDQGTTDELAADAGFLAPAVTYYFMPINLYVTAAVGIGLLGISHDDDENVSSGPDDGFGLNLDAGKEWWVGEQWGLGAGARFWYAVGTDERGLDADFEGLGAGILLSATYQ